MVGMCRGCRGGDGGVVDSLPTPTPGNPLCIEGPRVVSGWSDDGLFKHLGPRNKYEIPDDIDHYFSITRGSARFWKNLEQHREVLSDLEDLQFQIGR